MILFHRPEITLAEEAAVLRVLRSGWLTTGSEAEAFEREFAELVGAGAAVAMSSCTAALHVGLRGFDISEGDEVLVPTMTFAATAQAVHFCDASPVLVDIDPETGNMSLEAAQRALTKGTAAAIWVHYGGNPTGYQKFTAWAQSQGVAVLEDAAHAFSATVGERSVGGLSTPAAFSFYPTKPISTSEGGMLTLPKGTEQRFVDEARMMTLHGIDQAAYQRSRGTAYHYEVTQEGYKYNLPDLLAAMGRSQLPRAAASQARRAAIAKFYREFLPSDLVHVRIDSNVTSSHHLFVIRIPPGALKIDRDEFAGHLREAGVGSSVHYRPLHRHKFWSSHYDRNLLRQSEAFYAYCLSLPIFQAMTDAEADQVVDVFSRVWKAHQL